MDVCIGGMSLTTGPQLSFDSGSSRSTSSTNSFISEIDHWDSDLDIEDSQPDVAYFASVGYKVG